MQSLDEIRVSLGLRSASDELLSGSRQLRVRLASKSSCQGRESGEGEGRGREDYHGEGSRRGASEGACEERERVCEERERVCALEGAW
eukprot:2999534-Rhodomonas_salina.2